MISALLNNSEFFHLQLYLSEFIPTTVSVGLDFALSFLVYHDFKNAFVVYYYALLKLSKIVYLKNMRC